MSIRNSVKWPATSMTAGGSTLVTSMVSLGRATFGLVPLSLLIAKPSMAEGSPSLSGIWGVPSSSAWLFAMGTSISVLPPVPLLSTQGTLALCGDPWALWSAKAGLVQKSRLPLWWSLNEQSHCSHSAFCIFLWERSAFWAISLLLKTK